VVELRFMDLRSDVSSNGKRQRCATLAAQFKDAKNRTSFYWQGRLRFCYFFEEKIKLCALAVVFIADYFIFYSGG